MLIQITNNCDMGCPHCMQDSKVGQFHMTDETFMNTIRFGKFLGNYRYNISGGEPTSHPRFREFIEILISNLQSEKLRLPEMLSDIILQRYPSFTVESNGSFIENEEIFDFLVKTLKNERMEYLQVCSVKGLYKNFDLIKKNIQKLNQMHGTKVGVCTAGIRSMKDLGRAATNEKYKKQAEEDKHYMSCINGCLAAKQINNPKDYSLALLVSEQSCKPFVDWKGNVHVSESITCPSVGNVNTDNFYDIWKGIRKFKPCGRCSGYKKFINSNEPKIVTSKKIIGV